MEVTKPQSKIKSETIEKYVFALSLGLTVLIFLLVSLGGLVRGAGAGLSCPDWPLCHGQAMPSQMFEKTAHVSGQAPAQIFLEWFHRMIAGSVSIGLLVLSIVVFTNEKLRARAGKTCGIAIALLMSQVVLGGMTVLGLLSPKWVVSHLAVGLAFFSVMLWITLSLKETTSVDKSKFALITLLTLYVQIILGGLVSSNYAGLACADFPTCNGDLIPPFEGLVKFQFMHRLGALISTVVLLAFSAKTLASKVSGMTKTAAVALPTLLFVQVALGIGMIYFTLPLLMSVAHLAVATAMLGATVILVFKMRSAV